MKKRIVAAAVMCSCVLMLAACKQPTVGSTPDVQQGQNSVHGGEQNNEEIPVPEYTIKAEPLTDTVSLRDTGEVLFTKTIERVRITAQHEAYVDAAKKIASTMKRATDRNEDEAEFIKESTLSALADGTEGIIGLPWTLEAKYETVSAGGKVVCILEHIYNYAGGAYPLYVDFGYNFDAETGAQLYLEDFFPIDDEEKTVQTEAMLMAKLDEKYPDTVQDSFIQTNLVDMATDSWCFTENGMKIWYNEQELAPHAAGKLEIELTREELPESALAYLD